MDQPAGLWTSKHREQKHAQQHQQPQQQQQRAQQQQQQHALQHQSQERDREGSCLASPPIISSPSSEHSGSVNRHDDADGAEELQTDGESVTSFNFEGKGGGSHAHRSLKLPLQGMSSYAHSFHLHGNHSPLEERKHGNGCAIESGALHPDSPLHSDDETEQDLEQPAPRFHPEEDLSHSSPPSSHSHHTREKRTGSPIRAAAVHDVGADRKRAHTSAADLTQAMKHVRDSTPVDSDRDLWDRLEAPLSPPLSPGGLRDCAVDRPSDLSAISLSSHALQADTLLLMHGEPAHNDSTMAPLATTISRPSMQQHTVLLTDCNDRSQARSFNVIPVRHCMFATSSRAPASLYTACLRAHFMQPEIMMRAVKPIKTGEAIILLREPGMARELVLQCFCGFEVCQYHTVCYCSAAAQGESNGGKQANCPWPSDMHDVKMQSNSLAVLMPMQTNAQAMGNGAVADHGCA